MAEDVHRRFLRERKKSVKADVLKAREEYQSIVNYLSEVLKQVLLPYFHWQIMFFEVWQAWKLHEFLLNLIFFLPTGVFTKPWGYAVQHIPVSVSSQDKLGGLRQEGHLPFGVKMGED